MQHQAVRTEGGIGKADCDKDPLLNRYWHFSTVLAGLPIQHQRSLSLRSQETFGELSSTSAFLASSLDASDNR
jgi:hypothetical protein